MGAVLAPMIESMEQQVRRDMVGGGHGLNPFGHIQGRERLFSESLPSLTAGQAPNAIADDDMYKPNVMTDKDTRLLKTAVDGIPSTIMSDDTKKRVIAVDESVIPELTKFMKEKFNKDKTPILMSFGIILRYFWKFESVRATLEACSLVGDLVIASMTSKDTHLVGVCLGLLVNISSTIRLNSLTLNAVLMEAVKTWLPPSDGERNSIADLRLRCTIYANILELSPISEDNKEGMFEALRQSIHILCDKRNLIESGIIENVGKAIEKCSGRIHESGVPGFRLGASIAHESLIGMAEALGREHALNFEQTLMLCLE
jgi:hypothetical protein